jgi:hypothetical protein
VDNRLELLTAAFERADIPNAQEVAAKVIAYFPPQVTEIERTEDRCVLEISSCPDASIVSAVLSGGIHVSSYALPDGHEHTLMRIGNCALTVGHFFKEEQLTKIILVELIRPIPLGEKVHISLTKGESVVTRHGTFTTSDLKGWLPSTGKHVFTPTQVVTYRRNS